MSNFNIGDKVVLVGTTRPVMVVKGHPTYASGTGETDFNLLVCFWEDSEGPHWENFRPTELISFIDT